VRFKRYGKRKRRYFKRYGIFDIFLNILLVILLLAITGGIMIGAYKSTVRLPLKILAFTFGFYFFIRGVYAIGYYIRIWRRVKRRKRR